MCVSELMLKLEGILERDGDVEVSLDEVDDVGDRYSVGVGLRAGSNVVMSSAIFMGESPLW